MRNITRYTAAALLLLSGCDFLSNTGVNWSSIDTRSFVHNLTAEARAPEMVGFGKSARHWAFAPKMAGECAGSPSSEYVLPSDISQMSSWLSEPEKKAIFVTGDAVSLKSIDAYARPMALAYRLDYCKPDASIPVLEFDVPKFITENKSLLDADGAYEKLFEKLVSQNGKAVYLLKYISSVAEIYPTEAKRQKGISLAQMLSIFTSKGSVPLLMVSDSYFDSLAPSVHEQAHRLALAPVRSSEAFGYFVQIAAAEKQRGKKGVLDEQAIAQLAGLTHAFLPSKPLLGEMRAIWAAYALDPKEPRAGTTYVAPGAHPQVVAVVKIIAKRANLTPKNLTDTDAYKMEELKVGQTYVAAKYAELLSDVIDEKIALLRNYFLSKQDRATFIKELTENLKDRFDKLDATLGDVIGELNTVTGANAKSVAESLKRLRERLTELKEASEKNEQSAGESIQMAGKLKRMLGIVQDRIKAGNFKLANEITVALDEMAAGLLTVDTFLKAGNKFFANQIKTALAVLDSQMNAVKDAIEGGSDKLASEIVPLVNDHVKALEEFKKQFHAGGDVSQALASLDWSVRVILIGRLKAINQTLASGGDVYKAIARTDTLLNGRLADLNAIKDRLSKGDIKIAIDATIKIQSQMAESLKRLEKEFKGDQVSLENFLTKMEDTQRKLIAAIYKSLEDKFVGEHAKKLFAGMIERMHGRMIAEVEKIYTNAKLTAAEKKTYVDAANAYLKSSYDAAAKIYADTKLTDAEKKTYVDAANTYLKSSYDALATIYKDTKLTDAEKKTYVDAANAYLKSSYDAAAKIYADTKLTDAEKKTYVDAANTYLKSSYDALATIYKDAKLTDAEKKTYVDAANAYLKSSYDAAAKIYADTKLTDAEKKTYVDAANTYLKSSYDALAKIYADTKLTDAEKKTYVDAANAYLKSSYDAAAKIYADTKLTDAEKKTYVDAANTYLKSSYDALATIYKDAKLTDAEKKTYVDAANAYLKSSYDAAAKIYADTKLTDAEKKTYVDAANTYLKSSYDALAKIYADTKLTDAEKKTYVDAANAYLKSSYDAAAKIYADTKLTDAEKKTYVDAANTYLKSSYDALATIYKDAKLTDAEKKTYVDAANAYLKSSYDAAAKIYADTKLTDAEKKTYVDAANTYLKSSYDALATIYKDAKLTDAEKKTYVDAANAYLKSSYDAAAKIYADTKLTDAEKKTYVDAANTYLKSSYDALATIYKDAKLTDAEKKAYETAAQKVMKKHYDALAVIAKNTKLTFQDKLVFTELVSDAHKVTVAALTQMVKDKTLTEAEKKGINDEVESLVNQLKGIKTALEGGNVDAVHKALQMKIEEFDRKLEDIKGSADQQYNERTAKLLDEANYFNTQSGLVEAARIAAGFDAPYKRTADNLTSIKKNMDNILQRSSVGGALYFKSNASEMCKYLLDVLKRNGDFNERMYAVAIPEFIEIVRYYSAYMSKLAETGIALNNSDVYTKNFAFSVYYYSHYGAWKNDEKKALYLLNISKIKACVKSLADAAVVNTNTDLLSKCYWDNSF